MAVTVSPVWHKEIGTNGIVQLGITATDVTFDNSYPTGGEAVTAANLGLVSIIWAQPASADGYTFEFDHANSKIIAYQTDPAPATWTITDNDDAATDGVVIYVHKFESAVQEQSYIGHLEFVSPTNADTVVTQAGHTLRVLDDDAAATLGALLFVAPAGGGFYANVGTGGGVYLPTQQGGMLHVQQDADPATNQSAVQVYVDEDAAGGVAQRMQAVVADNADETFLMAQQGWNQSAVGGQVNDTTDLSSVTTRVLAYGPALA